jgi:hypothetical protein
MDIQELLVPEEDLKRDIEKEKLYFSIQKADYLRDRMRNTKVQQTLEEIEW